MRLDTLIIGAGISGLTLGHALARRGRNVTLLEASARAGGVVHTVDEQGFLTESGPNSFLDRYPDVRELLRELSLEDRVVQASPTSRKRYVFTRGRLWPVSPPSLLASSLLSLRGRLRLLLEPFSRRGGGEDESLARFARRHLGREATETLVDALQAGIFAGDPERLSARSAFPSLVALERQHRSLLVGALRAARGERPGGTLSLKGGLGTLVDALARELGTRLRTGVQVARLERREPGWAVVLENGQTLSAAQLVLALPPWAAAPLVAPLDASLAAKLERIPYAPAATVHLGFEKGRFTPPPGFGFLVPGSAKRKLLGAIFTSTLFPERAPTDATLITCILGGVRAPEIAEQSEAQLVATARAELEVTLGVTDEPRYSRASVWPRAIPQYQVGHDALLGEIDERVERWPGLWLTGNAYRGSGLADCIRQNRQLANRL